MKLKQIKKDFMNIAERYNSKDYLTASYRNYLFDGCASIHNTKFGEQNEVCMSFSKNKQRYYSNSFKQTRDYEIKAFLFNMMLYVKENDFTRIEMYIMDGSLRVEAFEETSVYLED